VVIAIEAATEASEMAGISVAEVDTAPIAPDATLNHEVEVEAAKEVEAEVEAEA
jgi:hypothetical protein